MSETAAGRRLTHTATIPLFRVGDLIFRDVAVVLGTARDDREDGLLPITMFAKVYFAADRKSVVVN